MRIILLFLLLSSNAFAQRAGTILVEIVSPSHYELTISGVHPSVDRITLNSQAEVQKFTGIESQPEINLKSQPDWYRIWFYDGADPYVPEGGVDRIDFHFSSGKQFTINTVTPQQKATTDTILSAKAAYDPLPVVPSKLDPATKNKVNLTDPIAPIIIFLPAADSKTDNPP